MAVSSTSGQSAGNPISVVIVGAGIAGTSACEAILAKSPDTKVTLINGEPVGPYYRLNLTRYLADEIAADQLPLHPEDWYAQMNVELITGNPVAGVELEGRTVTLADGATVAFDKLILATGAQVFVPPIEGADKAGVTGLRTLADVQRVLEHARAGDRVVVVGGGVLGLETAGGVKVQGADVSIVCSGPWLMQRELNERGGRLMNAHVESTGIRLYTDAMVEAVVGDTKAEGVRLADGTVISADLVVLSTGIKPAVELARAMGLKVDRGVVVDDRMFTSHPDVLAAGDVAQHGGVVEGLWMPARMQGQVAGLGAIGIEKDYSTGNHAVILKIIELSTYSIGQITPDADCVVIDQEVDGKYYYFVFRKARMVGAILMGDARRGVRAKRVIEGNIDCSELLAGNPTAVEVMDWVMGRK